MDEHVTTVPQADRPKAAPRSKRRGWRLAALLLIVVLVGAGVAWWFIGAEPQVSYTTVETSRGAVVRGVSATGTVNPDLTIIVGTYVSGVIQDLYCDYNTVVTKGQICAKIDPRPFQSAVDQSKANLAVAQAQLQKDQAALAYAEQALRRAVHLISKSDVSQDTYDNAKSNYDQAQAQTALDRATIQQRQAELDAAEVNLAYTDIVSPVDGVVVSRNVTMGQTVAASFQTPTLFLIATDLTRMVVDTNVSESDIGNVKDGDAATFTVDAFPRRTFEGTVSQVRQSPQIVQNVVTYDVVLSVDNADLALKPGMTAATFIVTERHDDVLRVPNAALRYRPTAAEAAAADEPHVWVLRGGEPVAVSVVTGLADDSFTEIVSGDLEPGDQVITAERTDAEGQTAMPRMPL